MKRGYDHTQASPGVTTRSATRRKRAKALKERQMRDRANRAAVQNPFEKALSLVMSNGSLYRHDCVSAALACKGCNDVWEENRPDLPEPSTVEVLSDVEACTDCGEATHWLENYGVGVGLLTSLAFLRQVYDKINRLRVEAEPSKKKQASAQEALLKFGEGITRISVFVFDCGAVGLVFQQKWTGGWMPVLLVHLREDLTLAKASNLGRRGHRMYDGMPLWP